MQITKWIRSEAASGQALNIHSVKRRRPDLLEQAFAGETPRGWRRSLIDAGVDPYKIVHDHEDVVECAVCGTAGYVLGSHLNTVHGLTGEEYRQEFGSERELSSELFRAHRFRSKPIAGIDHWERMWSREYIIDWVIRLHEEGHSVNFSSVSTFSRTLASTGWVLFDSWDTVLEASGLDPRVERLHPPGVQWTHAKVLESVREFAQLRKANGRGRLSASLELAMRRYFGTTGDACEAAGLERDEVLAIAAYDEEPKRQLLAAIRALEGLKGRERKQKLAEIYPENKLYKRIVSSHYTSLKKLAIKENIPPRLVATVTYRDEADVMHELDLLEEAGLPLTFKTFYDNDLKGLYSAIMKTGWGLERLKVKRVMTARFPAFDPLSRQLRDRMIMLRHKLEISRTSAAKQVGLSFSSWCNLENGEGEADASSIHKIEKFLTQHNTPPQGFIR